MTEQDETKKVIMLIKQKLEDTDNPTLVSDEHSFDQWVQETEGTLANIFGESSRQLTNFRASLQKPVLVLYYDGDQPISQQLTQHRREQLSYAKATLKALLSEIETFSLRKTQQAPWEDTVKSPIGFRPPSKE